MNNERKYTTSERLKQYMEANDVQQVDILNKAKPIAEKYGVKMNKSDISQYVSGKFEPKQDKIKVLSEALGVSEVWLMGYEIDDDKAITSPLIRQTVNKMKELNAEGQRKVYDYTSDLCNTGEYTKITRLKDFSTDEDDEVNLDFVASGLKDKDKVKELVKRIKEEDERNQ